ncbi:MAG: exosortase-associated EpsI family protein [Planctomycetes bacterium]|nr:exosortase-associated EpsI family protein [Planctomycetota bacterium]
MTRKSKQFLIAPLITLLVMAALAAESYSRPSPGDAEPYHAAITAAAAQLPTRIGDWVGVNEPIQKEAIRLLKPNVIYNRVFTNPVIGQRVTVLLVQCKDARDIYGHYPPVCYPAHGLAQRSAKPFDRYIEGEPIHGMEYVFASDTFGAQELTVDNFILLPGGETARDMKSVRSQAWDYQRRFLGAGQVQVVYQDSKLTDEQRAEIFNELVTAHMPVIKAILHGAPQ